MLSLPARLRVSGEADRLEHDNQLWPLSDVDNNISQLCSKCLILLQIIDISFPRSCNEHADQHNKGVCSRIHLNSKNAAAAS